MTIAAAATTFNNNFQQQEMVAVMAARTGKSHTIGMGHFFKRPQTTISKNCDRSTVVNSWLGRLGLVVFPTLSEWTHSVNPANQKKDVRFPLLVRVSKVRC